MGASEIAREWFVRVWQQRDREAIEEMMAPRAMGHLRNCEVIGSAGFVQLWEGYLSAVPDLQVLIEDVVGEDDRAVVRWRFRGTHTGEGLGMPPSHKTLDFTGMTMVRVENGKLVEGWDEWDMGGVMSRLASGRA